MKLRTKLAVTGVVAIVSGFSFAASQGYANILQPTDDTIGTVQTTTPTDNSPAPSADTTQPADTSDPSQPASDSPAPVQTAQAKPAAAPAPTKPQPTPVVPARCPLVQDGHFVYVNDDQLVYTTDCPATQQAPAATQQAAADTQTTDTTSTNAGDTAVSNPNTP
jgi:outer membrane biosynthesis protein TonB